MQNEDPLLDKYFGKARKATPIISVTEMRSKLSKPVSKASLSLKAVLYGTAFTIVAGIFIGYLYSFKAYNKGHKQPVSHHPKNNTPASPLKASKFDSTSVPKQVKHKPTRYESLSQSPQQQMQEKQDSSTAITILPEKDTVPLVHHASTGYGEIAPSKVSSSGIVIYQFSLPEKMAIYQKKLSEVGITMNIQKVNYDKVYKNRIILLHADFLIEGILYKTISLKDFKELRIQWEIDTLGKTSIKSMNILDQNYILKPL